MGKSDDLEIITFLHDKITKGILTQELKDIANKIFEMVKSGQDCKSYIAKMTMVSPHRKLLECAMQQTQYGGAARRSAKTRTKRIKRVKRNKTLGGGGDKSVGHVSSSEAAALTMWVAFVACCFYYFLG